ncbi:hypothetical protein AAVH_18927 [Aphelenchoides avenae]|nr:hypothetical protein AAVH_18927 [Aphelenchus avenae]
MKPDFLVRKRRCLTDGINYLAHTLNGNMWITMAVTFCMMTLVAILCKAAKRQRSGAACSPFQITWQVLQIQLRQSKPICPNSISAKVALFLFSLLQCGLILSLFEATLVSQLLLGGTIPPKTDEDIIRLIGSRRLTFISESLDSR